MQSVAIKESATMQIAPIKAELVVDASQERAFRVFTEEHGAWWPLAHYHIGEKAAETAVIEPRAGGRWYERAQDGTECPWGKVLVWDPPGRLVLAWQIGANWKYDPDLVTEVEVRFIALGPARTRIELEHRKLDQYGDAAQAAREQLAGGWPALVQAFATRAAGAKT